MRASITGSTRSTETVGNRRRPGLLERRPGEGGEKKISQPAFYITRGGLSVEAGLLAMALLHNPRHRLPRCSRKGKGASEKVGAARITGGGNARPISRSTC